VCIEDSIETILTTELGLLEADLTSNVKTLIQPLLTLFDFFELPDVVYEQIVGDFVEGRVT
jgi:hypothetical protein